MKNHGLSCGGERANVRRAIYIFAVMVALGLLWRADGAFAQVISDIRVEGAQRIENETIISYMTIRTGDPFDAQKLDQSLKSLFATGLFSDVTMRREITVIVVRVVENPVINRISFEGNDKIDDETLAAEVQLRPRVVYTRTKIQNDVRRILDIYRRSGNFGATVEPKAITLPQNRVDIVFEISEGESTGIERITFIGNKYFSDGDLREVIITTESSWWNFLTSNDNYDPDRLTFDREILRRFYLSEGYADFRVISAVAELSPDRTGFYITFTVDEGERYRFGVIAVESSIKNLSSEELRESVTFEEGDWYDAEEIEKSINALTDRVGVLGFAFVEIRPNIQRDQETLTLSVTFLIQEGPRVYVERIDIVGNTRTLDYVIRRELRLIEGDPFNSQKVQVSRQRVENLNFFQSIDVKTRPGSQPDRTVIEVSVVEQPTGEFSLGAGFSTDEGPLATIGVSERNFLGRGQSVRVGFSLSGRSQQLDLSFTEPYFLDYNIAAGIDLFRVSFDDANSGAFARDTTGGSLRTGYPLAEDVRQSLFYSIRNDNITDVSPSASPVIKEQEGKTLTSLVGQSITWDKRDNARFPTKGHFIKIGTDYAGLGGDATFVRISGEAGVIIPLWEQWDLTVSGEASLVEGINDPVRVQHRFFRGGNDLRGFATSGIGPRDAVTGDALGGKYFYTGTIELSFPVGLPESLGVRGKIFTDFGSLWGIDPEVIPTDVMPPVVVLDSSAMRASVGVGALVQTPFGPIRIDIAQAIVKQSFDETQMIHFSFGTTF